jgi:hypothetical protein
MGLPDDYRLPPGSTAAWKVVGDGVAAPVVRWLAEHLLEPLCERREASRPEPTIHPSPSRTAAAGPMSPPTAQAETRPWIP